MTADPGAALAFGDEAGAEEAALAGLLGGALALAREDVAAEEGADRGEGGGAEAADEGGADGGGGEGAPGSGASGHGFSILEAGPVGAAEEGVAAADDAGVDGGHDEGGGPAAEVVVVDGALLVGRGGGFGGAGGVEGVGVREEAAEGAVAADLLDDVEEAGDGAAADPPAGGAEDEANGAGLLLVGLAEVLDHHVDAEVRGDGVEAAAGDDADAGLPGLVVVLVDHAAHPLDLAGDVGVVGLGLDAGGDEGAAVEGEGPHGGAEGPGLGGHGAEGGGVAGVGDEEREVREGRVLAGEVGPDLLEFCAVSPGDAPA